MRSTHILHPRTTVAGTSAALTLGFALLAAPMAHAAGLDAGNQAPLAVADGFFVNEGEPLVVAAPGLLANDVDSAGDVIAPDAVTAPDGGPLPGESLDVSAGDGSFTYTPPTGYVGQRVWAYQISDGELISAPATITITVLEGDKAPPPVNAPPIAVDDAYSMDAGSTLDVAAIDGLLANDSDPENSPLGMSFYEVPNVGQLDTDIDGSLTFTPPLDFSGVVEFEYASTDGTLNSNTAIVSITVNALPKAAPDPTEPPMPEEPAHEGGQPAVEKPAGQPPAGRLASTGVELMPLGAIAAVLLGLGVLARMVGSRRAT